MKNLKVFRKRLLKLLFLCFLMFTIFFESFSQRTITGKVTTFDGETLPSVNVTIKGTTKGTVSNINGEYEVQIPGDDAILSFSYVGFLSEEIPTDGRSVIDVTLIEDIQSLSEVIVVGYGTQKKSDLTGAITQVKADDFKEAAVLGVDQALQGRAAGVQITQNSGMPGAGVLINVRGMGTWNDSDPLYVIDGVPVENDISFLNPADIETIEILKDASAGAIYGARAANGVVLITTKKGKEGHSSINFDFYTGTQSAWRYVDMANADEYIKLYNDIRIAAGYDPNNPREERLFIPDSLGGEGTNWQEEIFRPAKIQNYNLSFLGGTEKISYGITGNYYQQDGIVKGSDFTRFTFRANTDIKVSEKLTVGERFSIGQTTLHEVPRGGARSPHQLALAADPIPPVYRDPDDPLYEEETARWSELFWSKQPNPIGYLERIDNERVKVPVFANAFLEYEILQGLTFKINGGLNLLFHDWQSFNQTFYEGGFSQNDMTSLTQSTWKNSSWLYENTLTYQRLFGNVHDITVLAGYSRQLNRIQDLLTYKVNFPGNDEAYRYLTFGTEVVQPADISGTVTESAIESYFGRMIYSLADKYLVTASLRRDGSSRFGPESEPKYGNTARYDYFPSFSLGWKISEEGFFQNNISFINFMKIRFGWGQLGNDRTDRGNDYPWFSAIESNTNLQNYVFGGQIATGSAIVGKAIKDIRWERSSQSNIGLDMNLLQNRITFSGDYYVKRTIDQLVPVPLPLIVGVFDNPVDTKLGGNPLMNAGEVQNKGIELMATYRKKEGKLKYDISVNFTRNENEVIKLGPDVEAIETGGIQGASISHTRPGYPIASFWGYVTDGLFQESDDTDGDGLVDNQPFITDEEGNMVYMQPKAAPGDIRFKDLNGDNELGEDDKQYIGSPHPDFTYGINFHLEYLGFDFMMFWQGVQGNDIFSANIRDFFGGEPSTNFHRDLLDGYSSPSEDGTDPGNINSDIPRLDGTQANNNFRVSDFYIYDGSYLRLKNLQLGYTLPRQWLSFAGINKLRIYIAAQNLITITDYKYGYDPEIGQDYNNYGRRQEKDNEQSLEIGIDRGVYPQAKSYMFGINLTF